MRSVTKDQQNITKFINKCVERFLWGKNSAQTFNLDTTRTPVSGTKWNIMREEREEREERGAREEREDREEREERGAREEREEREER